MSFFERYRETIPDDRWNYHAACVEAADRQGLVPMALSLACLNIPFRIDQTGGFTMVLYVPLGENKELGITRDGGWWAVYYDYDNDDDDVIIGEFDSMFKVIDQIFQLRVR